MTWLSIVVAYLVVASLLSVLMGRCIHVGTGEGQ